MRKILDLNNVEPADSDYPYGRVKDISSPGAGDGTPANEALLGDMTQTFMKMMDAAGITANGLPDNDYSGFQIYQAFRSIARPYKVYSALLSQSGTSAPTATVLGLSDIGNIVWTRVSTGVYNGTLSNAFDASKTLVLGGQGKMNTSTGIASIRRETDSIIRVETENTAGISVDSFLSNTPIEIRVYEDVSTL